MVRLLNVLSLVCLSMAALGAMATPSYDAKESLMMWNRTPKVANNFWSSACDECQTIMKHIAEIAKDPSKLGELKMLLNLLCHECSYEQECRLFVSNIDRFLDKLMPFLKDPHAACQHLHICGSSKLEQFHRVGMLFAKKYMNKVDGAHDLICEECQFAAHELQSVIEDKKYQTEVRQFLSDNVCAHMGQFRGVCDEALENFLPDFFEELVEMLKDNKQFCVDIQLCGRSSSGAGLTSSSSSSTQEIESGDTASQKNRKVSKRIIYHFLKH